MARIRMIFRKRGRICFVPHVEMPPLFCRALRRAGAMIEQTQGMVPHPRISLGPALPVGVPAMGEPLEVWLEEWNKSILYSLNGTLPEGIRVLRAGQVDGRPRLNDECEAALYRIFLRDQFSHSRIIRLAGEGWIPVPQTLSISTASKWFDLVLGSPGQVGAGTVVKKLVSEGIIGSWKDLLISRLAVGAWTGRGVLPLTCDNGVSG